MRRAVLPVLILLGAVGGGVAVAAVPDPDPCANLADGKPYEKCRFDRIESKIDALSLPPTGTPTSSPTSSPTGSPTGSPTTSPPTPTATATPTGLPTPITAPACATSGATGAGSPSNLVNVAAPVANGGDSSVLIQNAINSASASGGGKVALRAGTYWINRAVTIRSNVSLTGTSMATTILKAGASSNLPTMLTTRGGSNITLEKMTVNQNGNNGHSTQQWQTYMVEARDSTNVIFQNVATREPSTYSMTAVGGSRFCFRSNDVRQAPAQNHLNWIQNDGIHILNASNGDVRHNFVDNSFEGATGGDDGLVAHAYGGNVANVTYEGNVVRGGRHGAGMGVWTADGGRISNITVVNNEFWGHSGVHPGDAVNLANSKFIDNVFHNNSMAIRLAGNGMTVTGNYLCASGPLSITGSGNTVTRNVTYTGCTNAPSTIATAPKYPPVA